MGKKTLGLGAIPVALLVICVTNTTICYLLTKDVFSSSRSTPVHTWLRRTTLYGIQNTPSQIWGVRQKGTYVKHRDLRIWSLWSMWVDAIIPLSTSYVSCIGWENDPLKHSSGCEDGLAVFTICVCSVHRDEYVLLMVMDHEWWTSLKSGPHGSNSICYDMQLVITTGWCVWSTSWFDKKTQLPRHRKSMKIPERGPEYALATSSFWCTCHAHVWVKLDLGLQYRRGVMTRWLVRPLVSSLSAGEQLYRLFEDRKVAMRNI